MSKIKSYYSDQIEEGMRGILICAGLGIDIYPFYQNVYSEEYVNNLISEIEVKTDEINILRDRCKELERLANIPEMKCWEYELI